MKLSAWAKANGLAYQTAWRLWRAGKLPIAAEHLPTGTVIVHPPKAPTVESVAIYARVSSADQKGDLERQLGRLAEYAADTDEAGHLFQPEAGRRSDLKPDAVPRRSRTAFRFEDGR